MPDPVDLEAPAQPGDCALSVAPDLPVQDGDHRADERPRRRADRTRRAVAAAVAVAGEHGLRVEEPVVLNDRFSVQVHLAPAPVVAGFSSWTAVVRQGTSPVDPRLAPLRRRSTGHA